MAKTKPKSSYVPNGKGTGHRYPKPYRERVLAFMNAMRKHQGNDKGLVFKTSRHFGIAYTTILNWKGEGNRSQKPVKTDNTMAEVRKKFVQLKKDFIRIQKLLK